MPWITNVEKTNIHHIIIEELKLGGSLNTLKSGLPKAIQSSIPEDAPNESERLLKWLDFLSEHHVSVHLKVLLERAVQCSNSHPSTAKLNVFVVRFGTAVSGAPIDQPKRNTRKILCLVLVVVSIGMYAYVRTPTYRDLAAQDALRNEFRANILKNSEFDQQFIEVDCVDWDTAKFDAFMLLCCSLMKQHSILLKNANAMVSVGGLADDENLVDLRISTAPNLSGTIDLQHFHALQFLELGNCGVEKIVYGPSPTGKSKLKETRFNGCKVLKLVDATHMSKMEFLKIFECPILQTLSLPQKPTSLRILDLSICPNLQRIDMLDKQLQLRFMSVVKIPIKQFNGSLPQLEVMEFDGLAADFSFDGFDFSRKAARVHIWDIELKMLFVKQFPDVSVLAERNSQRLEEFLNE